MSLTESPSDFLPSATTYTHRCAWNQLTESSFSNLHIRWFAPSHQTHICEFAFENLRPTHSSNYFPFKLQPAIIIPSMHVDDMHWMCTVHIHLIFIHHLFEASCENMIVSSGQRVTDETGPACVNSTFYRRRCASIVPTIAHRPESVNNERNHSQWPVASNCGARTPTECIQISIHTKIGCLHIVKHIQSPML